MTRLSLLLCLLCYSIASLAQDDIDETKMVGFACFYEGRETKVVSRVGKLMNQKKYSRIKSMLTSNNTAEQYLAVICLERLKKDGKVIVSDDEIAVMEKIRSSSELVATCSGCFPDPGIPLKDVFTSRLIWRETFWLDKYLK
jgi:hypothetical protein